MGEWARKKPHWWQYRLDGQTQPCADVLRRRENGLNVALWDALPMGGIGMTPLVEGVLLEQAKAAVERHASRQGGGARHAVCDG